MSALGLPAALGTARLVLRQLAGRDAAGLYAAMGRVAVEPCASRAAAVALVRRYRADFRAGARAVYGLFRRGADGELLGCAQLALSGLSATAVTLGYWLDPEHRGQGYAGEAAAALTGLAFARLPITRVEIACDAFNRPSVRVAERLGFELAATLPRWIATDDGAHDQLIWRLDRARFADSPASRVVIAEDETRTRDDDDDERWAELIDALEAQHPVRHRDEQRAVVGVRVSLAADRNFVQDVMIERGQEASGAPWLMLTALIGGETLMDAKVALQHNATLAVGAIALADEALLLRAGVDAAIDPPSLTRQVQLVADEATRLRVVCLWERGVARAATEPGVASSLQSWWVR